MGYTEVANIEADVAFCRSRAMVAMLLAKLRPLIVI